MATRPLTDEEQRAVDYRRDQAARAAARAALDEDLRGDDAARARLEEAWRPVLAEPWRPPC